MRLSETAEYASLAEWGTETQVSEDIIDAVLARLGPRSVSAHPGGSAFNTVHALSHMHLGLRLGMVGVAGRSPSPGLSLPRLLDDCGIDRRYVDVRDDASGRCVSFIEDGERTMLTAEGANRHAVHWLKDNRSDLLEYLANTRVVHVASIFEHGSADVLADLLREVRSVSPHTTVSFDPGYAWAANLTDAVRSIVELSSMLFLNYREFQLLGGYVHAEDDKSTAARLFGACGENCELIVLKKYDGVEIFRLDAGDVLYEKVTRVPLAVDVIEDATGAGDVFAAGVLASAASTQLQARVGVSLGLTLAREKLGHVGTSGHGKFADLTSELFDKMLSRAGEDRDICTLVFVDIVGSTDTARRVGDAESSRRLNIYKECVRDRLSQWRGHEANNPGDGFLLVFDSPGMAIECVRVIRKNLEAHGIAIRAGIHTGPVTREAGGDVSGLAVNIAARVAADANAAEVVLSRTTRDLVDDGFFKVSWRKRIQLRGLDEEWDLYEVMESAG
ncbi:MAG: PfkB family carbohydrate kinase [Actinomycetota bacterium]|nr:PfkB family carbohydrate kinase [Actinomycetota bacterium]